ncbi:helix-turn-helix domain-containing protein [Chitinophaga sp. SYP-B3965]|uniref:helix-turn-helix domain-containing protein n=1 Tax=Chitinophaga sp. SYP-B3965 TaxID=2663120 RepID=UPI001299E84B|nr:helix-turn-helix domain-containing protein [Chitinophaga sp. SYP-B3965]MRG47215.1 helix-turn-helix domain-containing protein [Chitinophaga sp. SYP-B3965]
MSYHQYKPHPALHPYIDAYWTVTSGSQTSTRILPDGCVDLICNLGSPLTSDNTILAPDNVYLIGTMTRFSETINHPDTHLLGIRFKPGAFALFYDHPLHEAADQCIEFERSLLDVRNLDQYFLDKQKHKHHVLLPIIEDIIAQNGTSKISTLTKKHFITERQLERCFKQYTGISPKAFSNIIRFRAVINQIRHNTESLETIAFMNGFYDHAHLTHEIKKYTGHTPVQL